MESTNGLPAKEMQRGQAISPREFMMRYIKYLPWIIISLSIAIIVAKLRLRYSIPIYRSEARLLIKRESPGARGGDKFDDIFSGGTFQNVFNEMELLKSRPLGARVARALNLRTVCYNKGNIRSTLLYKDAPIALAPVSINDTLANITVQITVVNNDRFTVGEDPKQYTFGEPVNIGYTPYRVIKLVPQVHNVSASNIYTLSRISLAQAAEMVVGGLKVNLADNFAQIINLSYESENTSLAEDILNTLMEVYRESNIEDKRQNRITTLEFIEERLDSLRMELGIVEKDLTSYIEKNNAFELSKQSELYLQRLSAESTNRIEQEVKTNVLDWLIRYLSNEDNAFRAVPVDLGTQEPTLMPLINQYNQLQQERLSALATTPASNPLIVDINSRLNKLREDIVEGLKNVRQSYEIAARSMRSESATTESKLQSIPGKGQQLAERQRQQKIKEELYLFLLQKKEETSIASASTISDSKVVEPARSSGAPISPNRRSIYMMSLFIGLAIPTGIIILRQLWNDKVTGKADIEKITDTPFIGEIGHSETKGALIVTRNSRRFLSEQFRIMRTNLQFLLNRVEKPVIMVTSSISGEGKSFVSINMGAVMALTGKRTVILELDIRKPKVVSNLQLEKHIGITNYIVGNVRVEDMLLPVPGTENLFVIPCGPIPPNPAEMLLDPKLGELFQYVRKHFDAVIVDTAPVGLVSDAMVIGDHADCTLYILRQGYTFKKQLELIDELYKHKKLPRLSILLNDVKGGTGYGGYGYGNYGYGYGYGYGHGEYFESEKKRKRWWQAPKKWFS